MSSSTGHCSHCGCEFGEGHSRIECPGQSNTQTAAVEKSSLPEQLEAILLRHRATVEAGRIQEQHRVCSWLRRRIRNTKDRLVRAELEAVLRFVARQPETFRMAWMQSEEVGGE